MSDRAIREFIKNNLKIEIETYFYEKTTSIHLKLYNEELDYWETISDIDLPNPINP